MPIAKHLRVFFPHPFVVLAFFVSFEFVTGVTAAGYYFSDHGFFSNSCPVKECGTCGIGKYRKGCANTNEGICEDCTPIADATFVSHGWFNNSCGFTCNQGFAVGSDRSCNRLVEQFSISFNVVMGIDAAADVSAVMSGYVDGLATQSGCGACVDLTAQPTICGSCAIENSYTVTSDTVSRRLLAGGKQLTVDTTIKINDNRQLAEAATSSISPASVTANIPAVTSVQVTTPPKLAVATVVMTSAPRLTTATAVSSRPTTSWRPVTSGPNSRSTTTARANVQTTSSLNRVTTTASPSTPSTTPLPGSDGGSDVVIIAVVAGIGVLVLVLVVVLVVCAASGQAPPQQSSVVAVPVQNAAVAMPAQNAAVTMTTQPGVAAPTGSVFAFKRVQRGRDDGFNLSSRIVYAAHPSR